ncbi:hypothetical protein D9613_002442 [Agrocybe pediades]|uniref:Uncharacterized protein n=1 Tax=Agrocybe pediades TaxID=84607 RepID=A0A8H4VMH9_9AGAR|nr:hypothetical protein D9613_002442 [Agrocybe pediades]
MFIVDLPGSQAGPVSPASPKLSRDTSFPRCRVVPLPYGRAETYSRSLLPLGHGYPLWDPIGTYPRPRKHSEEGYFLGDVGRLMQDGGFRFMFNIFLLADDEVQVKTPPNFQPLPPLQCSEIIKIDMFFPPGTVLASNGITHKRVSEAPLEVEFSMNLREGAIAILPQGASREDLTTEAQARVLEYVNQNAQAWYRFANEVDGGWGSCPNGSLYILTGFDRSASWAIATYPLGPQVPPRQSSITYKHDDPESGHRGWLGATERGIAGKWDCMSNFDSHRRSRAKQSHLFIRGFRPSVNPMFWKKHVLRNLPPVISQISYYNVLSKATAVGSVIRPKDNPPRPEGESEEVPFHPLDVIAKIAFKKHPKAKVVMVHDDLLRGFGAEGSWTLPRLIKIFSQFVDDAQFNNDDGLVTVKHIDKASSKSPPSTIKEFILHAPSAIAYLLMRHEIHAGNMRIISEIIPGPGPNHV